jgi:ankyrin repeat protein
LKTEKDVNPLDHLPKYQVWFKSPAPRILYIHGGRGLQNIAEQVFYSLEGEAEVKGRAIVLYFSFDRWDNQCSSVRDMIATFMAQIANHYPELDGLISRFFTHLHKERGWTEADLVQFFERFRMTAEIGQTMIVLDHFDDCAQDSRKTFIDIVIYRYDQDESPWRIVVTSDRSGALSDELSGPFCVSIDLSSSDLWTHTVGSFGDKLQQLTKLRPDLSTQREKFREQIEFMNELEPSLRQIISEQAITHGEWPDETSIQEIFGSLDLTKGLNNSEETLKEVLDWVLRRFPDQAILRRLLSWLLYAVRPLTVWELTTVLWVGTEQDHGQIAPGVGAVDDLISKMQRWLAGIIEMENNRVRLSHVNLVNIMRANSLFETASTEKHHLWDEIRDTAQSEITALCLEYLSRASVQEFLTKQTSLIDDPNMVETPTSSDKTNLISYALQAWTYHYSRSSSALDLSTVASDASITKTLAKGHWALANPITRSPKCFKTLFPLLAGLGLLNAVEVLDEEDALQGLLEAARNGQHRVIQDLLKTDQFSETQLWEALQASASSGNEDMMLSLLDRIMLTTNKKLEDIDWPPVLIYRAAWLNLDRFAERILALGCPPDPAVEWRTTMKASPLFQAARAGHTKLIRVLLKHGASMNFTGIWGQNPLHIAAITGQTDAVKLLMEEGNTEIDCPAEHNLTALYLAAVNGHHKTLGQLLDMGADPNMGLSADSPHPDQWTPLIATCEDGFDRCVRLLLDRGGNPNMSGVGGPPLAWAVRKSHLDIFNMLIAAGGDPKSEMIQTPLLILCVAGKFGPADLAILKRLLETGLDVNAKHADEDWTPLLNAAASYFTEDRDGTLIFESNPHRDDAVQMLLDHGADPNLCDATGATAMHFAVAKQQHNVARMLLDRGADPNKMSKSGVTPLFESLRNGKDTRLLLEKGGKPDLVMADGWTNLTYSAGCGYEEAVAALLGHGATVDLCYGEGVAEPRESWLIGWTPVMCAALMGHSDIVRKLAEEGANMQHKAGKSQYPAIHPAAGGKALSSFLEYSARVDVNQVDGEGRTALYSSEVSLDNLRRLVNAGANIEIEDEKGDTVLTATVNRDFECIKYLVEKGAKIHHISPWYGSALHQACRNSKFEVVKLLVEKGADLNAVCDALPGTPLQALCLRHGTDISPSLVEQIARYLLDEDDEKPHVRPKDRRADVTVEAGLFGFAITAAAAANTPNIINLILDQQGATVDVKDGVGRMPVHLAALNGIGNFEAILDRGGDIHAKDKLGRAALHWAAHGGRLKVVERIIALLDDKEAIDAPDIDGWTPLCWAARGPQLWLDEPHATEGAAQAEVIKLLLEHGADRDVVTTIGDDRWTVLQIARYHRCSAEVASILLSRRESDSAHGEGTDKGLSTTIGALEDNTKEETKSKVGARHESYCDACQAVGPRPPPTSCLMIWYSLTRCRRKSWDSFGSARLAHGYVTASSATPMLNSFTRRGTSMGEKVEKRTRRTRQTMQLQ